MQNVLFNKYSTIIAINCKSLRVSIKFHLLSLSTNIGRVLCRQMLTTTPSKIGQKAFVSTLQFAISLPLARHLTPENTSNAVNFNCLSNVYLFTIIQKSQFI